MANKLIMIGEFALSFILTGLGFTLNLTYLLQNAFLVFMGFIILILATHRLDKLQGNGQFSNQPKNNKTNVPPMNENSEDPEQF